MSAAKSLATEDKIAVKALIDPDLPPNAGYFRTVEVIASGFDRPQTRFRVG
jgi:hypothetical protein